MIIFFLFNLFEKFFFPDFYHSYLQFNPGHLVEQKFLITMGGEENFGLSSMRTMTAGIRMQTFQLVLKTFGNELYRENLFELSGGFTVYKGISAGIGIGVLNNWIKDYTNRFTYTLKLGSIFQMQGLKLGLCLNNINNPKFTEIDYLPVSYLLEMEYQINPYLKTYFNTATKQRETPFFNFGLIIIPVKEIELYTGMDTEIFNLEYGLKICLHRLAFDYAGSLHRQLGLSHTFFINFYK